VAMAFILSIEHDGAELDSVGTPRLEGINDRAVYSFVPEVVMVKGPIWTSRDCSFLSGWSSS
jgi:hypothetical protein